MKRRWLPIIAPLFVLFLLITQLYPSYLWFDSFGLNTIWIKEIQSKLIIFGFGFGIALIWLSAHVSIASRHCRNRKSEKTPPIQTGIPFLDQFLSQLQKNISQSQFSQLPRKVYRTLKITAVGLLSLFFGFLAKGHWESIILFLNQSPMGSIEPIFNKDISFYLFSIPLFNAIQGWVLTLIIISLIATFWLYLSENLIPALFKKQRIGKGIQGHILFLLGILLIILGIGEWLSRYDMLFASSGVVHGIGYTDHHIRLPLQSLTSIGYILLGLLIWLWPVLPLKKIPIYGGIGLVIIQLLGGSILPGMIQNYSVQPNEISKETPYMKNNIQFTRQAYGLNHITDEEFPVSNTLTLDSINAESLTMSNIRLWNREPLKQTFSQLQEIRLYYEFGNIDVDRYMINNQLQQVMLSPREMDTSQLTAQAQTWTNRHLIYTHGYGLCMSPVNEVSKEGLPKFYIKNLPPISPFMTITRPEIYFGEKANEYVIVNTKQEEFDYPKGDKNVYTNYQGNGGIQINSFLKRLIYALHFSDMKLLVSSLITSESRLLYDRSITAIVKKITPFIALDNDPYLVVSDTGRLVWMLDGYTFSSNFPYSEPFNHRLNYIRNAVKITIDAYDGQLNYYISDPTDPIINAYSQFYTTLFKPLSDMPKDLLAHIRYPKDLFSVQSYMYQTYHMTDPQVFYNREDLWAIPSETYEQSEQVMQPYHMVSRLPGDTKESFLMMLPFTPTNKNNMIAWMSAKCDPEEYGQIKVYKFPKERTIYGPMQIESRIDQNTDISQKLTLWGQMGSRVIRGNLMVIPIKDSLVYVEPIYLQATQSKFPELKRVIFSYGDKIVMAKTLDEAVTQVFQEIDNTHNQEIDNIPKKNKKQSTKKHLKALYQSFKSEKKINWTTFSELMNRLDQFLEN
jgi:uncharacterized membrane protein (UPF0182 family)